LEARDRVGIPKADAHRSARDRDPRLARRDRELAVDLAGSLAAPGHTVHVERRGPAEAGEGGAELHTAPVDPGERVVDEPHRIEVVRRIAVRVLGARELDVLILA